jgi:glycosyltransferase involved in cell wall biosynthesis
VIPNGVDSAYFSPAAAGPAASDPEGASLGDSPPPTMTFTGDMSYFPNEEAATFFAVKVLPLIQLAVPGARFLIVGRNPSRKVRKLQKIAGVEVTGWVPDVRPYLAQTRVSVAPFSIAAGIQNKILEAMACGLPVVGTPRAIQGLSNSVGRLVETGEGAAQLAEAAVRLLRDPELAMSRGMEGRRQVIADYSWRTALDSLLELVDHPGVRDVKRVVSERQVEKDLLLGKGRR